MIENKTEYSYAVYRDFSRFFLFRRRACWWALVAVCGVLSLVLMLLAAVQDPAQGFDLPLLLTVLLMAVLTLFCWFVYPRVGYRSAAKGVVQHYRFEEDRVAITTVGQGISAEQNLQYAGLYRVCETKGYFYLFLSARQAMIVRKAGFENREDIVPLRETLQRFVKKYKLYL